MAKCPNCKKELPTRTESQNRALWLFLSLLANSLNSAGLEMRHILKPTYHIPWTKDLCHDLLWIPIQKALFKTTSTKELTKSEQIEKVHEIIMRELGEKHGLEYISFPSAEQLEGMGKVGKNYSL